MKEETYKKRFQDFEIHHAAIRQRDIMAFVAHKSQPVTQTYKQREELPTRIVTYIPNMRSKDDGFGVIEFNKGIRYAYITLTDRVVAAESFGSVWESRTDGKSHKIVTDKEYKRFLSGITTIGDKVFACGSDRKVYRRNGFQDWSDLVDETKHDYVYHDIWEREKQNIKHLGHPMGFECLAGFDEGEIYAGGGYGDCWRYDGKLWHRIDLQTNNHIADIACADDGDTYICTTHGDIYKGRHDQWKHLDTKVDDSYGFAADVTSAAWFQDKLYLGTPFDLYVLENDKMRKYEFPSDGPTQSSFARVASCEEALLSYGNYQALIFDGDKWTEIVNRPLFSQN